MADGPPASAIFRGRERCGVDGCRSRRYYKDSGRTLCLQGHEQPEIEIDETGGDFQHLQSQRRSRVKKKPVERVSQIQRGSPGLLLYLQAYQKILQKQCQALVTKLGFPSELEQIVKDLWALRLQHYTEKIDESAAQVDAVFSSQLLEPEVSQDETNTAAKWKTKSLPTLVESLALCYLASIALRLPLSIGELHRYAVIEAVPFVRAIRFVPSMLKKRMPAEYQLALDTTTPLGPDHLWKTVHQLALLYQHHFSLILAPLNVPPLLCKYIRSLALPLEIYQFTMDLARMLDIDFTFPPPRGRQRTSYYPEVMLISLICIATKLYHPFDGRERHVTDEQARAIATIDWDVWAKSLQGHKARLKEGDGLARGSEMYLSEEDALQLSDKQMDDYLDWYERTWIDEERATQAPRGLPKQLLDMFPVSSGTEEAPFDVHAEASREHESKMVEVKEIMRGANLRKIIASNAESDTDDSIEPVGTRYKRYRSADELTKHARVFHEALAEEAAISLGTLLTAVLQVESRVLAWRKRQVTKETDASKDEGVAEGGEG